MINYKLQDIFVSVIMVTYGHEKYINQAIEGVLMQNCDFEIELIVANDCSPDNTDSVVNQIIKHHPRANRINYTEHKKNKGANENFIWAAQICKGKYIAICEGDDYWTDPLKLQKQVDFLETNHDYSIVWTKYHELIQDTNEIRQPLWEKNNRINSNFFIDLNNIFRPYCTNTLTTVFRKESLDLNAFNKLKYTKDNTLYAMSLTKGNGMLLDFYSSVYRLHNGGVYSSTTSLNQIYQSYLNLKEITQNISATSNIIEVRNGLLRQTLELTPLRLSINSLLILKDTIRYLEKRTVQKIIFQKFSKKVI